MRNFILTLLLFYRTWPCSQANQVRLQGPEKRQQRDLPNGRPAGIDQRFRGRYFRMVHFDPNDPSSTQGTILLDSASLHVRQPGPQGAYPWLRLDEREKIPDHQLQIIQARKHTKKRNRRFRRRQREMTIRNATIEMTAPIRITYLKGLLEKRNRVPGDLLVIRSKFIVKRDDFGIRAGENLEKVANQIEISLNVAGAAPSN